MRLTCSVWQKIPLICFINVSYTVQRLPENIFSEYTIITITQITVYIPLYRPIILLQQFDKDTTVVRTVKFFVKNKLKCTVY